MPVDIETGKNEATLTSATNESGKKARSHQHQLSNKPLMRMIIGIGALVVVLIALAAIGIIVAVLARKPSNYVQVEVARSTFFREMDASDAGDGTFEVSWNASFTRSAFPKFKGPQRRLERSGKPILALSATARRLHTEVADDADGSLWTMTRDTGDGILYTQEDAGGGPRWHVAWQLDDEGVVVHRTHANGLVYTYITDIPSAELTSAAWTSLEKRNCDVELRFNEYMLANMPSKLEDLLAQAGAGDETRQSMLDVKILSVKAHTASEAIFAGCTVPTNAKVDDEGLAALDAALDDDEEADDDEPDRDALAAYIDDIKQELEEKKELAASIETSETGETGETGSGDADDDDVDDDDDANDGEGGDFDVGTVDLLREFEPSEMKIQLWERQPGADRPHTCASYQFLNPVACDVLAPPTAVSRAARKLSEAGGGGGFAHTVSEGEFTQILLEAAAASPWLEATLYGDDPSRKNDPAYLEMLLAQLDLDKDGTISAAELEEAEAYAEDRDQQESSDAPMYAPSSDDGRRLAAPAGENAVIHGRKQFIFTAIAMAIKAAFWAIKIAAQIAARVAAAAARAAAAAARAAARAAQAAARAAARAAAKSARAVGRGAKSGLKRISKISKASTKVCSGRRLSDADAGTVERHEAGGRQMLKMEASHGRQMPLKCTNFRAGGQSLHWHRDGQYVLARINANKWAHIRFTVLKSGKGAKKAIGLSFNRVITPSAAKIGALPDKVSRAAARVFSQQASTWLNANKGAIRTAAWNSVKGKGIKW